jgi:poly(A) polymerase
MLQPRFERRQGRAPFKLLEHLRLRAGYDFLLLRCAADEAPTELGEWWTQFLQGDEAQRERLVAAASSAGGAPKRRRRGGRRSRARAAAADTGAQQ